MTTHTATSNSTSTSTLGPIGIGDVVTLTPRTAGAPSIAYRHPRARVVAITDPLVTVDLDDGTRLTTSRRNITRYGTATTADTAPKVRTLPGAPTRIHPRHGDELPLFDLDTLTDPQPPPVPGFMHCGQCGATGPDRPTTAEAETDAAWHDHQEHDDQPTATVR